MKRPARCHPLIYGIESVTNSDTCADAGADAGAAHTGADTATDSTHCAHRVDREQLHMNTFLCLSKKALSEKNAIAAMATSIGIWPAVGLADVRVGLPARILQSLVHNVLVTF